jgi:hypothetical protein
MAFTYAWDTDFGNNPEDSEGRRYGAQQIRKFKDAVTERLQIDHEFGEEIIGSGVDDQVDTGYHKRVTLKKTTVAEAAAGYMELGAETTNLKYFPEGGSKRTVVNTDEAQTLTNKTLTSPVITGGTLNGGAALTVNSTELNLLDALSGGPVGVTATQTLTNKTLTSPTLNTPTLNTPNLVTPKIGGTSLTATAAQLNALQAMAAAGLIPICVGDCNDASVNRYIGAAITFTRVSAGEYRIALAGVSDHETLIVVATQAVNSYCAVSYSTAYFTIFTGSASNFSFSAFQVN